MSTELESAKLFANYFQEDGAAPAVEGQPDATSYDQPTEGFQEIGFSATKWPGAMTVVCAMFYILGASGLIGGLLSVRSLANMEAAEILMSKVAGYSPEAQMAAASMAAQVKYSGYMYLCLGFRILCGCACFGAGSLLGKRFEGANFIAILVCGLLIFFNLCNLGVVYMTTSAVTEVPGISAGAAEIAMTFALGIAGVFFLIKLAVYCGVAYYLSRPSIEAIFKPKPKRKRSLSY